MTMDVLAILMVAFCLFAILMFILFYVYARKYYNARKISEDYTKLESDDIVDDTPKIELIDISINGKNYVFDANNHQLRYNDVVRININGNIYQGVVTKGNYKDDLGRYEQVPTRLILEEKEEVVDVPVYENEVNTYSDNNEMTEYNHQEETTVSNENNEFIPKKKIDN